MSADRDQAAAELEAALEAVTADAPPPAPRYVDIGGDAFDAVSLGVVRPGHAMAAVRKPDSLVAFEYQDSHLLIAARETETPNGRFVLLALAYDQGDRRIVTSAYRLYDGEELAALAADARAAFKVFLERYCIPFISRGRSVLFVPVHVTAPAANLDLVRELGLPLGGERWSFNGMVRRNSDGTWMLTWPFLISSDAYRSAITAHQR